MRRLCTAIGALLLMGSPAAIAQDTTPRTPWGAPDLQALWSNMTATPLERPPVFDSLTTTDTRAKAFEQSSRTSFLSDDSDGIGGRQSEWWEIEGEMTRIDGVARTSLIVEPANGRLPYSDAGRARLRTAIADVLRVYDNPETRPSSERCLAGGSGSTGAPIFMARYNTHYRLVQTPDHLVIAMEQNTSVRIIPITDKPQVSFRRWMGVSRAHWDGETLVVETAGFMPGDAFKPASPILISDKARVTERFTRLSEGELLYEYTVEDPELFTQTWRAQQVFLATDGPMFEAACHENNHSLPNILGGGRQLDRMTAAGKP
jgi:hypothetical protein